MEELVKINYNKFIEYSSSDRKVIITVSDIGCFTLFVRVEDDHIEKEGSTEHGYPLHNRIFVINNFYDLTTKNQEKIIDLVKFYTQNSLTNLFAAVMVFDFAKNDNDTFNKILNEVSVRDNDKFLAGLLSVTLIRPNISVEDFVSLLEYPLPNPGDLYAFRNYASQCVFTIKHRNFPSFKNEKDYKRYLKFINHICPDRIINTYASKILFVAYRDFDTYMKIFEDSGGYNVGTETAKKFAHILDIKNNAKEFEKYYPKLLERIISLEGNFNNFRSIRGFLSDDEYDKCKELVDLSDNYIKGLSYPNTLLINKITTLFSSYFFTALEHNSLIVLNDLITNFVKDYYPINNFLEDIPLRNNVEYYLKNYDGLPLDFFLEIEGTGWKY